MPKELIVYRGMLIPKKEIEDRFVKGEMINLKGFTSTSLSKRQALGFATDFDNPEIEDENKWPLLLKIQLTGIRQFFALNSEKYTAYP